MSVRTHSNCSITWTPGGSGETLVVAEAFMVDIGTIERKSAVATPWGWNAERRCVSQILGGGPIVVGFFGKPADATPPFPTGVQGTLRITLSTGDYHQYNAICTNFATQASNLSGEQPQVYLYTFYPSATTGTLSNEFTVVSA